MVGLTLAAHALLLVALSAGCATPRFDAENRRRGFDQLWSAIASGHADPAAIERMRPLRQAARESAAGAQTRREYLRAIASFLVELDDPHVCFEDAGAFLRGGSEERLTGICRESFIANGRLWVRVDARAELVGGSDADRALLDRFVCVAEVDGVSARTGGTIALAEALLVGRPGDEVRLLVEPAGDGNARSLTLRFPPTDAAAAPAGAVPAERLDSAAGELRPMRRRAADPRLLVATRGVRALRLTKDVGYIWIGDLKHEETVDAFDEAMDLLSDTDALILDLRLNNGGERGPIERVVRRFVDGMHVYAIAGVRFPRLLPIGDPVWWMRLSGLVSGCREPYRKPLVVLVDGTTLSAAEILAAALQDLCGATVVGEQTPGAGAAIWAVTLPGGLRVRYGAFPIWRADGRPLQGIGVTPDLAVAAEPRLIEEDGLAEWRRWSTRVAGFGLAVARARAGANVHARNSE